MTGLVLATTAHGAVMAALHARAFPPREQWEADAISLQLNLPGTFGALALHDAQPQGFVLARVVADEAEILTLAVDPGFRRQGVAGILLQDAETRAAQAGARSMFLEVAEPNAPARALYAGRDYRQVGLRRGYYADGANALVLRRQLGTLSRGEAKPP